MKDLFHRSNQYLFFIILLVAILHFGKVLLVPLAFGALLAMLMAPVSRYLEKKGFNRAFSSLTSTLILLFVMIGMIVVVGSQFSAFKEDFPKISQKTNSFVAKTQQYIERKVGIEPERQEQIVKEQAKSSPGSGGSFFKKFFSGLTTTVGTLLLMLVYTFLMLYNREQFENFFLKLYKEEDQRRVKKIVHDIATVSQKYLTGRAMSICIIAALYGIGLTLVGIKNALLLAGVAALLTLVPYVGTLLGGLFPVFMALATEDSIQPALWAGGVLLFIQTADNYFIEPNIVGGEVNLNAMTSIFSIVAGGLLWGVPGMILFLPFVGILKIICDHVDELKPFGYLIGEPDKQPSKIKLWIKEKLGKGNKQDK